MKIRFDCADNCRHKGVCKYVDGINKLDESLKAINPEGYNHVTIQVKCNYYTGKWCGGVARDGE
jgi:hypothetical protein